VGKKYDNRLSVSFSFFQSTNMRLYNVCGHENTFVIYTSSIYVTYCSAHFLHAQNFPVPAYAREGAGQWKYSCDYYSRFQGLSLYLGPGLSQAVEEFI
jgi:hypothetical protein